MNSRREISLPKLAEIWSQYHTFRVKILAPSTSDRDYRKITRRIEMMQDADAALNNTIAIRDWLLNKYSMDTTRRTVQQFNAACQWAVDSDILVTNPFAGVGRQLKKPKPRDTNWAAFTREERDRIIAAIDLAAPYYGPWVRFLFWTGCRPEEAAALKWKHVSLDNQEILIAEALPIGQKQAQSTKNYLSTRFPCNDRLVRLVREQRAKSDHGRESFMFPGQSGGRMHYTNFQRRHWRPIVQELAEKGQIAFYLSQYHCRHSWITGALEAGLSVQDVSYLARVSSNVIWKHYAGKSRRIVIPEF